MSVSLLIIAACTGQSTAEGGQQVEPEVVAVVEGLFAGAVETGDDLWIAVNHSRGAYRPFLGHRTFETAELRQIDADGSTKRRVEFETAGIIRGLHSADGRLWYRELLPFEALPASFALVSIDPASGGEVSRRSIPASHSFESFFSALDGNYWYSGAGSVFSYDLETGRSHRFEIGTIYPRLSGVHHDEEYIWFVRREQVEQVDRSTGELVAIHRLTDHHPDAPYLPAIKYHGGTFWAYLWVGRDEFLVEYDIETGELGNQIPIGTLPTRTFESGGYRWELYNSDWSGSVDDLPKVGDLWRRVDLKTNETIGEYDFGHYKPEIEANGYLWLTRWLGEDASTELARVPLS